MIWPYRRWVVLYWGTIFSLCWNNGRLISKWNRLNFRAKFASESCLNYSVTISLAYWMNSVRCQRSMVIFKAISMVFWPWFDPAGSVELRRWPWPWPWPWILPKMADFWPWPCDSETRFHLWTVYFEIGVKIVPNLRLFTSPASLPEQISGSTTVYIIWLT